METANFVQGYMMNIVHMEYEAFSSRFPFVFLSPQPCSWSDDKQRKATQKLFKCHNLLSLFRKTPWKVVKSIKTWQHKMITVLPRLGHIILDEAHTLMENHDYHGRSWWIDDNFNCRYTATCNILDALTIYSYLIRYFTLSALYLDRLVRCKSRWTSSKV